MRRLGLELVEARNLLSVAPTLPAVTTFADIAITRAAEAKLEADAVASVEFFDIGRLRTPLHGIAAERLSDLNDSVAELTYWQNQPLPGLSTVDDASDLGDRFIIADTALSSVLPLLQDAESPYRFGLFAPTDDFFAYSPSPLGGLRFVEPVAPISFPTGAPDSPPQSLILGDVILGDVSTRPLLSAPLLSNAPVSAEASFDDELSVDLAPAPPNTSSVIEIDSLATPVVIQVDGTRQQALVGDGLARLTIDPGNRPVESATIETVISTGDMMPTLTVPVDAPFLNPAIDLISSEPLGSMALGLRPESAEWLAFETERSTGVPPVDSTAATSFVYAPPILPSLESLPQSGESLISLPPPPTWPPEFPPSFDASPVPTASISSHVRSIEATPFVAEQTARDQPAPLVDQMDSSDVLDPFVDALSPSVSFAGPLFDVGADNYHPDTEMMSQSVTNPESLPRIPVASDEFIDIGAFPQTVALATAEQATRRPDASLDDTVAESPGSYRSGTYGSSRRIEYGDLHGPAAKQWHPAPSSQSPSIEREITSQPIPAETLALDVSSAPSSGSLHRPNEHPVSLAAVATVDRLMQNASALVDVVGSGLLEDASRLLPQRGSWTVTEVELRGASAGVQMPETTGPQSPEEHLSPSDHGAASLPTGLLLTATGAAYLAREKATQRRKVRPTIAEDRFIDLRLPRPRNG